MTDVRNSKYDSIHLRMFLVYAPVYLVGYNATAMFLPNPRNVWMHLSLASGWVGIAYLVTYYTVIRDE